MLVACVVVFVFGWNACRWVAMGGCPHAAVVAGPFSGFFPFLCWLVVGALLGVWDDTWLLFLSWYATGCRTWVADCCLVVGWLCVGVV